MTTTTPPVRPHRARRGEGERLRDELLDTADALLLETGSMDAVSMRAIAERTGVTPPSIYLHFEDKGELFFAVCERRFGELARAFDQVIQGTDDPAEQLRRMGQAYLGWGLSNPEHYGALFGGGIEVPDRVDLNDSPGRQALQAAVDAIQRGMEQERFTAGDPLTAAITLWASLHGFVHLATHKARFLPDIDLAARRDQVLETAVRALET